MSARWDFRTILDVRPDESGFTCVGVTKKGARCRNSFQSRSDLSRATEILDQMDSLKRLSSSYQFLEELAELTLCPRWHTKPSHSQVESTRKKWKRQIANYADKVELEREKIARAKSRRALSKMKESVVEVKEVMVDLKAKLEEEAAEEKVPVAKPMAPSTKIEKVQSTIIIESESKVSSFSATHRPRVCVADITPPPSIERKDSRAQNENTEVNVSSKVSSFLTSQDRLLPSPPVSLVLASTRSSDADKVQQSMPATPIKEAKVKRSEKTLTGTEATNFDIGAVAEKNDAISQSLSPSKTRLEAFNFQFQSTSDVTPGRDSHLVYEFKAGKQTPFPACDLKSTTSPPIFVPNGGAPSFKITEQRSQLSNDVQGSNSDPAYKLPSRPFDFSPPSHLQSPEEDPFSSRSGSSHESSANVKTAPIIRFGLLNHEASAEPIQNKVDDREGTQATAIITPTSTSDKPYLPPRQQYGLLTPEATPEPTQDESNDREESYGFAVVTPTSVRYKSYLPSQHHHGLVTPPETPDSSGGDPQDLLPALVSDSPPATASVPRKPLPVLLVSQAPNDNLKQSETRRVKIPSSCDDEDSTDENEGVGCFHSSRLRKLRKRVARKLTALKEKASGVLKKNPKPAGIR